MRVVKDLSARGKQHTCAWLRGALRSHHKYIHIYIYIYISIICIKLCIYIYTSYLNIYIYICIYIYISCVYIYIPYMHISYNYSIYHIDTPIFAPQLPPPYRPRWPPRRSCRGGSDAPRSAGCRKRPSACRKSMGNGCFMMFLGYIYI